MSQAVALDPKTRPGPREPDPALRTARPGDKAEQHYRAAVSLEPNRAASHYDFGVLLFEAKKYREAAAAFRQTLAVDPRHPDAHNNLGFLLEREGRRDEALRHFRAALESRPNFRLAHFHVGRLLLQQGQTAEAIRHLQQTLEPQDESTPGYLYALGAAHARAGQPRAGRAVLPSGPRPRRQRWDRLSFSPASSATSVPSSRESPLDPRPAARGPRLLAACSRPSATEQPASRPLFREAAAETGLDFQHFIGSTGQYYMPEIMGAGVALFDYDGDGDLDVFLRAGYDARARQVADRVALPTARRLEARQSPLPQ